MENYSNNKIFKFLAEKSSTLTIIFVAVVAVGILSFTGAGKYLLGSLSNGVNLLLNGNISNINHYAYGENIGWIDFDPIVSGNPTMQIGDNGLTGYAWGENVGWIMLGNSNGPDSINGYLNTSSSNWGVNNSTVGCDSGYSCLSGYAYGENVGWVNFDPVLSGTHYGVKISTTGGTAAHRRCVRKSSAARDEVAIRSHGDLRGQQWRIHRRRPRGRQGRSRRQRARHRRFACIRAP